MDEIAIEERVAEIEQEISEAFEEAKSAPYPRVDDLATGVYAS
jgi:TPP-dependent pyruvate/acetoin dehydrogenase alpha subunit